jgi:RNA polymerase-binding transcription factor DksA
MPALNTEPHAATAEDILGPKARSKAAKIDPRWRKHHDRLIRLKQRFSTRRSEHLHDGSTNSEPSFAENPANRGTDEYDLGSAFSLISSEQDAIYEIDQALDRISNGTYGICEASGQSIPEDRLEAIPWTRFALKAEEQIERDAAARKPKHVF